MGTLVWVHVGRSRRNRRFKRELGCDLGALISQRETVAETSSAEQRIASKCGPHDFRDV